MRYFVCGIYLLLICGCAVQHPINPDARVVYAVVETVPVTSNDDAADDAAIWIHPENPQASLILGTNKKLGLAVYNLRGEKVQFLEQGRLNNVDLRHAVPVDSGRQAIAVATNRTTQALDVFAISEQGQVTLVYQQPVTLAEPYGVCMQLDANGNAFAFANSKDGAYQQWLLNPEQVIQPRLVGSFKLDSQPEGCVVDDRTDTLYLGEENLGVWVMPAHAERANEKELLDRIDAGRLVADVEGMDIYHSDDGAWLVVSSQGDHSYAVYDVSRGPAEEGPVKNTSAYRGSFRISDNPDASIDGVQETDGLAVTSVNLGSDFPQGMLVVQDGYNELPKQNQNFKLVSWKDIAQALGL